jgi:hypothetical protein
VRRRAAALAATAVVAAAPTASAHELTTTERRVYEHRWQLSTYKLAWYQGRGRWTLRPRHGFCRELRWPRPRGRCFKHRENVRWHRARVARIGLLLWPPRPVVSTYSSAQAAICAVFGPYCSQAIAVAKCEAGRYWDLGIPEQAVNGQYLGTFQMGDRERATYGHGSTVYEQAAAAFRYFVASGRDWSPWECKP